MAGTIVADTIRADSTSTLVLKNGVANTPPTIQDSAGTQIGTFCRAWVNFNGTTNTGGFCTIRSSFNVTSVADNGTGNYTVNFTTAMPDVDYSISGNAGVAGVGAAGVFVCLQSADTTRGTQSTTACQVTNVSSGGSSVDPAYVNIAIFR
jgi:hypothetical protein